MLRNLQDSIRFSVTSLEEVKSQINAMDSKDVLVYVIRAQIAAVVSNLRPYLHRSRSLRPRCGDGRKGKTDLFVSWTCYRDSRHNCQRCYLSRRAWEFSRLDRDVLDEAAMRRKVNFIVPEGRDTMILDIPDRYIPWPRGHC